MKKKILALLPAVSLGLKSDSEIFTATPDVGDEWLFVTLRQAISPTAVILRWWTIIKP